MPLMGQQASAPQPLRNRAGREVIWSGVARHSYRGKGSSGGPKLVIKYSGKKLTYFTFLYNLFSEIKHMTLPNHRRTERAFNAYRKRNYWNYLSNSTNDNYLKILTI